MGQGKRSCRSAVDRGKEQKVAVPLTEIPGDRQSDLHGRVRNRRRYYRVAEADRRFLCDILELYPAVNPELRRVFIGCNTADFLCRCFQISKSRISISCFQISVIAVRILQLFCINDCVNLIVPFIKCR